MGLKASLIFAAVIISAHPAFANDCISILDSAARLACFDKSAAPVSKGAPKGDAQIEKAKAAVRAILKDPQSARFLDTKKMPTGVCGQLNAKNGYGGYSGVILFAYRNSDNKAYIVQPGNTDPSVLTAIDAHDEICGK